MEGSTEVPGSEGQVQPETAIAEAQTAPDAPSADEKIQEILSVLCQVTDSEIRLEAPKDGGKVVPVFDLNGVISKIAALAVYCGMSVPATFAPSYNRVHADVEFWKKKLAE